MERKKRAVTRSLKGARSEDSPRVVEETNAQADPTDELGKISTKDERKSSKVKEKGGETKTAKHSDDDTQVQQREQNTGAPSQFRITSMMLSEKVKLNSNKSVVCIARRRMYKRYYIEMLIWNESFQWLRLKFIKGHFKEAIEEFDRARKEGRVTSGGITGFHSMELLENVRLIDGVSSGSSPLLAVQNEDRGTRLISYVQAAGHNINSGEDQDSEDQDSEDQDSENDDSENDDSENDDSEDTSGSDCGAPSDQKNNPALPRSKYDGPPGLNEQNSSEEAKTQSEQGETRVGEAAQRPRKHRKRGLSVAAGEQLSAKRLKNQMAMEADDE